MRGSGGTPVWCLRRKTSASLAPGTGLAVVVERKHMTLQVLWKEYRAEHPEEYRYSRLRFVPPVERPVAAGYAPEAPAARNCFSTTPVIDKLTLAKREGRVAARMKSLGRAKLQLCPPLSLDLRCQAHERTSPPPSPNLLCAVRAQRRSNKSIASNGYHEDTERITS